MQWNKKGLQLSDLSTVAIIFVVAAVVLSMSGTILADINAGQVAGSYAANATTNGLVSVGKLAGWMPTLATVTAAAIIIGVLVGAFMRGRE